MSTPAKTPGVLETTRPVVEQASHVAIDYEQIQRLCQRWVRDGFDVPGWDQEAHWAGAPEATCNAVLLLDALNFCFWPDPGEPAWTVQYRARRRNGYMALATSLKRAAEEGVPLFCADYVAELSLEQLAHIFRGEQQVPMLEQRLANAREVGQVLRERFEGSFARCVERAGRSAVRLTELLVEHFPSFRDVAVYAGREVRFLKRAQICVIDLLGTFGGRSYGEFDDARLLTAFADYKIPQVLRAQGVLVYDAELAEVVDNRRLIPAGSPPEVEIRASMIWAVERIRQELERLGKCLAPYELDWLLWNLGQRALPDARPYHLTRTIFY